MDISKIDNFQFSIRNKKISNARSKITSTARQGGDRPNDNSEYCNSNYVNEWGVYSTASAEFQLAG